MTHKLTIIGTNYEGAHFRGFPSDTDDTLLSITVQSESEAKITNWVLDNFSYGPPKYPLSIDGLIGAYIHESVFNGDGCGLVAKIIHDGKEVYENEWVDLDDEEEPILVLKDVNLDEETPDLNRLVREQKVFMEEE